MVDWFNAIRAARFHYLQVAFPGASNTDLVPKLSRNYLKEGYMEKTGPKQTEGFKKRWFTMDDRRLMYFKDPLVSCPPPPPPPLLHLFKYTSSLQIVNIPAPWSLWTGLGFHLPHHLGSLL
ncbi:arf-GAP with dual PH domain-containing protein 1-like [Pseudonaja textilis]|nr:arf-GAP with dual PH domain-containing protein 1-like [Pseudonaja textilis]